MKILGSIKISLDKFLQNFRTKEFSFIPYKNWSTYVQLSLPGIIFIHPEEKRTEEQKKEGIGAKWKNYEMLEIRHQLKEHPNILLTLYLPVEVGHLQRRAWNKYEIKNGILMLWENHYSVVENFYCITLPNEIELFYTETLETYQKSWNSLFELLVQTEKDGKKRCVDISPKIAYEGIFGRNDIIFQNILFGIQNKANKSKVNYKIQIGPSLDSDNFNITF